MDYNDPTLDFECQVNMNYFGPNLRLIQRVICDLFANLCAGALPSVQK